MHLNLKGDYITYLLIFASFKAKTREKEMVKEVLTNVDSDGSTLLHLAVDSESCAVSTFFAQQFSFNCDSSLRLMLIV